MKFRIPFVSSTSSFIVEFDLSRLRRRPVELRREDGCRQEQSQGKALRTSSASIDLFCGERINTIRVASQTLSCLCSVTAFPPFSNSFTASGGRWSWPSSLSPMPPCWESPGGGALLRPFFRQLRWLLRDELWRLSLQNQRSLGKGCRAALPLPAAAVHPQSATLAPVARLYS